MSDQENKGAVDTGKRVDVLTKTSPKLFIRRPKIQSLEWTEKPKEEEPKESIEEQPTFEQPILAKEVEPLIFDESGDFASMLDDFGIQAAPLSLSVGEKVTGKIIHIGKEHAFLSLGPKLEAAMAVQELQDQNGNMIFQVGDRVSALVFSMTDGILLSNKMAHSDFDASFLEDAKAKRLPIEGKVMAVNKGGFEIKIGQKRAFCPLGQIDDRYIENPETFVGKNLHFFIEKIEESGKNIVLSRRALLEAKKKEDALRLLPGLEIGDKFEAIITRLADFGAFADIGGLEGLIPRSEVSHGHISKVSDVLTLGQKVLVQVSALEKNFEDIKKTRITLSIKQTLEDPYITHGEELKEGSTLEGRVVRLENFGAFIELFPGIDGLIHISELSENKVAHPKDVLSVDDPVTVRIMTVDPKEKRISLSLRESVGKKKDEKTQLKLDRGQKVQGRVSRIERYGVFVALSSGATALLPGSETGFPKGSDLSKAFKIGDALETIVIDIDNQNRIRVSLIAKQKQDERDSYLSFQQKENSQMGSFGTMADVFNIKNK